MSREFLDFLTFHPLPLPSKERRKIRKEGSADAPLERYLIKKGVGALIAWTSVIPWWLELGSI